MEEKPLLRDFKSDLKERLYKCEDFGQLSVTLDSFTERKHEQLSTREEIWSELQTLPYDVLGQVTIKTKGQMVRWGNHFRWMLHAQ